MDNINICFDPTSNQHKYVQTLKLKLHERRRTAKGEVDLRNQYFKRIPKIMKSSDDASTCACVLF